MSKKRNKENKYLPQNWRIKNGAYYYRVPRGLQHLWDGKTEFRLGKTEAEAYDVWIQKTVEKDDIYTISELLHRYKAEVIPKKRGKTQELNIQSIKNLLPVFGHMPVMSLRPVHVLKYYDKRFEQSPWGARHDFQLIRHALTVARSWGVIDTNILLGLEVKKPKKKKKQPLTDHQIIEFYKVCPDWLIAYIRLKLATGLRRQDLLLLTNENITEEGILVTPRKTEDSSAKAMLFEMTPHLRGVLDECEKDKRKLSKGRTSTYLFPNRKGEPYVDSRGFANGFDSLWQRLMKKALKETEMGTRFNEHLIRAKVANEAPEGRAHKLLGHPDPRTTKEHYGYQPERVIPLRLDIKPAKK